MSVHTRFSSSEIAEAGHDDGGRLQLLLRRENVPESESFVACASNKGPSVGTRRQVQNSVGVASEGGDLFHRRIPPHVDLVLAVAVR